MPAAYLAPRFWPLWLALGLIRLTVALPYSVQRPVGFGLGRLLRLFAHRRRRITRVNLKRCFPELAPAARRRLERRHFESLGLGFIETGMCWWASGARLRQLARIEGLDNLLAAQAKGHGVILLTAHFTTLEIGGALLSQFVHVHMMYRPHKNPLLDAIILKGRSKRVGRAVPRDNVRALLKSLRDGVPVWYAPDQGFRRVGSVTAPFFGVPAPTSSATARIARVSGAPVVPFFVERLPSRAGYLIRLLPALEDFPGHDDVTATARVNAVLESGIRRCPEQYLWSHDRFKLVPRRRRPAAADAD